MNAMETDRRQTGIEHKTLPFELKAAAAGSADYAGEFEGYAAGIMNIDSAGDMILPGAFSADLPRFLAEGVICWQHDWMTPIGVPLDAREDFYGLWSKCRISKTQQGQDAMTLISDGVVKKLSIGYRVEDYDYVDRAGLNAYLMGSGCSTQKCGEILKSYDEQELDGLYLLKKLKLYEYSPVTVPANNNAIITGAKSLTGLAFVDHSKAVLDAVAGLKERIAEITAIRHASGRKGNSAHCEMCRTMADDLETMCGDLRQMASEMMPAPAPVPMPETSNADVAKALYAEFIKLQAAAIGAA